MAAKINMHIYIHIFFPVIITIYIGIMPCQLYWFAVIVSQINTKEEGLHTDSISVGKILSMNNQTIKLTCNQQW